MPSVPRAPYSLTPTTFPFPALASMAGRAPLGGPREVALACFLVARIVHDGTGFPSLPSELRLHRIQGIKHWLGAASIPTAIRNALSRLADAAATGDSGALRTALGSVMTVTANLLDPGARLELTRLAQAVAG